MQINKRMEMIMSKQLLISISVALLLSTTVATNSMAQTAPKEDTWKGSVEFGLVNTTGNTETQTIKSRAKVEVDKAKWLHTGALETLTSSEDDSSTAERYEVNAQSNYKLSGVKKNYIYFMVNYEDDRFSGYDYRVTESIGYGRRVVDKESLTLDLEAGPGARQSELEDGGSEDETIFRGAAKLGWKLSDASTLTEVLSTEVGEDSTVSKSVTALTAKVIGELAMKITFTVKNTTDVPDDTENTDTETAVTLLYAF